jgi:beta-N-acetylhexosaminidase
MQAVASRPKLAVEVVAAGVDILLMPNDPAGAVRQVKRATGSSQLPTRRLREAVMHVLEAKQRLGLLDEAPRYPKPPSVKQSKRVARSASSAGTTVLGSCAILVERGATVIGSGAAATGVRQGLRAAGIPSGPVRVVVQASSPGAADVWVATGSPYGALRAPARQRVLTYGDVAASGWAAGQAIAGRLDRLGGLPVRGPKACSSLR